MQVIIEKRHTEKTTYDDCMDCALCRAVKEQYPSFQLRSVGGGYIRNMNRDRFFFDSKTWNCSRFYELQTGELAKVVLEIPVPHLDNVKPEIKSTFKEITFTKIKEQIPSLSEN